MNLIYISDIYFYLSYSPTVCNNGTDSRQENNSKHFQFKSLLDDSKTKQLYWNSSYF